MSDLEEIKENIKKWLIISIVSGVLGAIIFGFLSQGRIEGVGYGFLIGFFAPLIIMIIVGEIMP